MLLINGQCAPDFYSLSTFGCHLLHPLTPLPRKTRLPETLPTWMGPGSLGKGIQWEPAFKKEMGDKIDRSLSEKEKARARETSMRVEVEVELSLIQKNDWLPSTVTWNNLQDFSHFVVSLCFIPTVLHSPSLFCFSLYLSPLPPPVHSFPFNWHFSVQFVWHFVFFFYFSYTIAFYLFYIKFVRLKSLIAWQRYFLYLIFICLFYLLHLN